MPEKTGKNRRPAPISYRPPKGREAEFRARVAASGKSANGFLNDCVFSKRQRGSADRQDLARLLHIAGQISDQLDDITLTGGDNNVLTIESCHVELREIRNALLALMGRKP